MVYAVVFQLDSLRSLLADLQTNPQAKASGFSPTPYSNFRDAFSRFRLAYFKVVLLEIRLKQLYLKKQAQIVEKQTNMEEVNTYSGKQPEIWIKAISQFFYNYWKITKQWLRHLKNVCSQEFEDSVIKILATT